MTSGHCESSLGSFDECRTVHKRPSTLRPSHLTWAVSPPVCSYRLQPPSPFTIITQPESWYSFTVPRRVEGWVDLVHLKEKSLLKKRRKPCRNWPINGNAMLVRTIHSSNARCSGLGAWPKQKQTPHFRTYSRRALCDFPQTLQMIELVETTKVGVIHFSIQHIVFPTGCTEKFGLIYWRTVSLQ